MPAHDNINKPLRAYCLICNCGCDWPLVNEGEEDGEQYIRIFKTRSEAEDECSQLSTDDDGSRPRVALVEMKLISE